jgi:ribose 5-phosphate isomerase B
VKIAVGGDHAGFALKTEIASLLAASGHQVEDIGAYDASPSDYPDFARRVAQIVVSGACERGVLVCGSGVGASIAANKVPGIRAALCHDTFSARQGVEDDDMNVLCLGSRVIGPALAQEVLRAPRGAVLQAPSGTSAASARSKRSKRSPRGRLRSAEREPP